MDGMLVMRASVSRNCQRRKTPSGRIVTLTLPSAKYWPPAAFKAFSMLVSQLHKTSTMGDDKGHQDGDGEGDGATGTEVLGYIFSTMASNVCRWGANHL